MKNEFFISPWEQSYSRNENFIFYPKEEVVKFLNRYVRRRIGVNEFKDILTYPEGHNLRGLDLGCGIGRQTVLLAEFGISAWGGDISSRALSTARELATNMSDKMKGNASFFQIKEEVKLNFDDHFFDICICDSVLDSMWFDIARQYIFELDRTVNGLLFLTLISEECNPLKGTGDVKVETQHERDTIQSYYDLQRINELLDGTNWRIQWSNLSKEYDANGELKNARYHLVLINR